MMPFILGIDPGIKGALTLLGYDGKLNWCVDMPSDEQKIARILRDLEYGSVVHCYIEDTITPRWQNVKAIRTTNINYGILRGMLEMVGIPYTVVNPRTWESQLFKGLPRGEGKSRAYYVCGKLFPEIELCDEDGELYYDGRADSALIAYYGYKTEEKKGNGS
jgi:hypothetical protein